MWLVVSNKTKMKFQDGKNDPINMQFFTAKPLY